MTDVSRLMEETCRFFENHLGKYPRHFLLRQYGFTNETIAKARIGFAPYPKYKLIAHLRKLGFTDVEIDLSGITAKQRENETVLMAGWRARIMFPYLVNGAPQFFIGRATDQTPAYTDHPVPKYKKQRIVDGGITEPIFGVDTVLDGKSLIITEGITDCISVHQANYPGIAPVTTRFKEDHFEKVSAICKRASTVYIIMDSEDSNAGLNGAIDTGLELMKYGISPYLGIIPRPDSVEKVDLNDYVRKGGDIDKLFENSIPVEEHPLCNDRRCDEWNTAAKSLGSQIRSHRSMQSGTCQNPNRVHDEVDVNEVLAAIPPLSLLTGVNGQGVHPVYGSKTGTNLHVDGDRWHCFHKGHEGGGGKLEWIAIYELGHIKEGEKLRGWDYIDTLNYAAEKYLYKTKTCSS